MRIAVALCGIYFLLSGALGALQHLTFHTRARDMGIYAQILWNASQGRGLTSTLLAENTNHLAEHVAPVLWVLAPMYGVVAQPAALVVTQQLFLAASGIPVFLWSRRVLGSGALALLVLLTYLAMPALSRIALSEFHPVVMAALPTSIAAYGVFTVRPRLSMGGAIVALLFEEEASLVVIGLGLSWMVRSRVHWRWGAALAGLGALWLVLVTLVVMPAFQNRASREAGNRTAAHYRDLIQNPIGRTVEYVRERGPGAVAWLLLPNAGLALLSPSSLLAAAPATAVLFFQDRDDTYGGHWAGVMIPIFAMATAAGLARLRRWGALPTRLGVSALALVSTGNFIVNSHFPGGGDFDLDKFVLAQADRDLADAVAQVPPAARVIASRRAVPHLAHRTGVWQFPSTLYARPLRPDADRQDIIVFDLADSMTRRQLEDLNGDTVLTGRPRYHVRQYGDSILLLSRAAPAPTVPLEASVPGLITLRGFDLERLSDQLRVRAYWQTQGRPPAAAGAPVRVLRLTDERGTILAEQAVTPLAAVLPPSRWERGQLLAEQGTVPLPARYRGPVRLALGWRDASGVPIPFADGAELVEIFRMPEL